MRVSLFEGNGVSRVEGFKTRRLSYLGSGPVKPGRGKEGTGDIPGHRHGQDEPCISFRSRPRPSPETDPESLYTERPTGVGVPRPSVGETGAGTRARERLCSSSLKVPFFRTPTKTGPSSSLTRSTFTWLGIPSVHVCSGVLYPVFLSPCVFHPDPCETRGYPQSGQIPRSLSVPGNSTGEYRVYGGSFRGKEGRLGPLPYGPHHHTGSSTVTFAVKGLSRPYEGDSDSDRDWVGVVL